MSYRAAMLVPCSPHAVMRRRNGRRASVVTCSYWIEESSRTVQGDRIASLNLPL